MNNNSKNSPSKLENLEFVVLDKDAFDYNFSNMNVYSITNKSEEFQYTLQGLVNTY